MSEHMEMPTLLFWENGNVWYGSKGNTRFFIRPVKHNPPEDQPEGETRYTLDVEVWPGPLTKSLSQITATNSFPRTLEGMDQMVQWLEEQAEKDNKQA